jgi:hypothetical protein
VHLGAANWFVEVVDGGLRHARAPLLAERVLSHRREPKIPGKQRPSYQSNMLSTNFKFSTADTLWWALAVRET